MIKNMFNYAANILHQKAFVKGFAKFSLVLIDNKMWKIFTI